MRRNTKQREKQREKEGKMKIEKKREREYGGTRAPNYCGHSERVGLFFKVKI